MSPAGHIVWTVWPIVTGVLVWIVSEELRQQQNPRTPEGRVRLQIQGFLLGGALGLLLLFFSLFLVSLYDDFDEKDSTRLNY